MGCVECTYTRLIYSKYSRGFGSLNFVVFAGPLFSLFFSLHGNTAAVYSTVYVAISRAVTNVSVIFLAVVYLGFVSLSLLSLSLVSAQFFSLP